MIFKETYNFMWWSTRKMKVTSVWAERLQKRLMRMRSPYLLSCISDFQRNLLLHVLHWTQNECKIRFNWKTAEVSRAHEIITFAQLNEWFSKNLTASCSDLNAKWRQHPCELKGCRSLSFSWSRHICSPALVIFKGTYSFMWCSRSKMKSISVGVQRLQKSLKPMKSPYLFTWIGDFQRNLQPHPRCKLNATSVCAARLQKTLMRMKSQCFFGDLAARVIFKGIYGFMWCSWSKMKGTSVWAERLYPLIRLNSQNFF